MIAKEGEQHRDIYINKSGYGEVTPMLNKTPTLSNVAHKPHEIPINITRIDSCSLEAEMLNIKLRCTTQSSLVGEATPYSNVAAPETGQAHSSSLENFNYHPFTSGLPLHRSEAIKSQ